MRILSLLPIRFVTFLLLQVGQKGLAMTYCSNSFRFDQLCPDPRFDSRVKAETQLPTNICIALNSNTSNIKSCHLKDHSSESCNFYINGIEKAIVKFVQVTDTPHRFSHADQCSHVVTFNYDSGFKQPVCHNEFGSVRGHRKNAYFWHNFTLRTQSAEFVDTITNFYWFNEQICCAHDSSKHLFVQIAIQVFKGTSCEIIVQQYKITESLLSGGCTSALLFNPFPIQFCGSYNCSQVNDLLTSVKLYSRGDFLTRCKAKIIDRPNEKHTVEFGVHKNEEAEWPVNWLEVGVKYGFPIAGIVLIFWVLCSLFKDDPTNV